jgi:surface protein
MQSMFNGATALNSLNISNWDMSAVSNTDYILYNTPVLSTVIYNEVDALKYSILLQKMSLSNYPPLIIDFIHGDNDCAVADTDCSDAQTLLENNKGWVFKAIAD